jgi:sulfonate transport system permease protein
MSSPVLELRPSQPYVAAFPVSTAPAAELNGLTVVLPAPARVAAKDVSQPAPVRLPASRPAGRFRLWLAGPGLRAFQAVVFPLFVLLAWTMVHHFEWLPANILPSPALVAQTFWEYLSGGELATHVGISLWRVAQGAGIGLVLGLALGVWLGFSDAAEAWVGPLFRTVAQIPSIILIPLFMMVLGIDDKLKLFVMAKACVIPLTLVTADGIRGISKNYLEVGAVFRLSRATRIRKIILPGALPSIFTGIRQGLAAVWVSLVAVEVLASAEGIGYLMTWGRLIFQLDVVFVCVAIIGVIGFLLDFSVRRTEAHFLKWKGAAA